MTRATRKPMGIGIKIVEALKERGETASDLARVFGVRVQSVQGWIVTGRIAKPKLPLLSKHFGKPLSWWLDGEDELMLEPDERKLLDLFRAIDVEALRAKVLQDTELIRDLARETKKTEPKKTK